MTRRLFDEVIFPVLIFIVVITVIVAISINLFTDKGYGKSFDAIPEMSFDHSACQYPLRKSNPPDGCDNTDPANPLCVVKTGYEECEIK